MSNAHKKVIVRRFTGDTIPGYLPLSGFVRGQHPGNTVSLLDLSGRVVDISLKEIKTICFVRDFNLADSINPERLTRRAFLARPRNEGLWLRLTFRSSDQLEGLAAMDLSLMDSLLEDAGVAISPPDIRSNTQRIFVPRAAISELQLLAVITTPSRVKPARERTAEQIRKELQENLFEAPTPPNTRPN